MIDKSMMLDVTDIDDTDPDGWIERKNDFYVPKYGNAVLYCGRTFCFSPKCLQFQKCPIGKIVSVVYKREDTQKILYFRYYNFKELRSLPQSGSKHFYYEKCSVMMKNGKNSLIALDKINGDRQLLGNALVGRSVQKGFKSNDCGHTSFKYYRGKIVAFNDNKYYSIIYADGDKEDVDEKEVVKILKN